MKQKFKKLFGKSRQRALVLACASVAYQAMFAGNAGATGAGAINDVASSFKSYLSPIQNLMYAIAAIIALMGGFSIFTKLQNGDQDVKKTILQVVGGCVAFIAMATALPKFFS